MNPYVLLVVLLFAGAMFLPLVELILRTDIVSRAMDWFEYVYLNDRVRNKPMYDDDL